MIGLMQNQFQNKSTKQNVQKHRSLKPRSRVTETNKNNFFKKHLGRTRSFRLAEIAHRSKLKTPGWLSDTTENTGTSYPQWSTAGWGYLVLCDSSRSLNNGGWGVCPHIQTSTADQKVLSVKVGGRPLSYLSVLSSTGHYYSAGLALRGRCQYGLLHFEHTTGMRSGSFSALSGIQGCPHL